MKSNFSNNKRKKRKYRKKLRKHSPEYYEQIRIKKMNRKLVTKTLISVIKMGFTLHKRSNSRLILKKESQQKNFIQAR